MVQVFLRPHTSNEIALGSPEAGVKLSVESLAGMGNPNLTIDQFIRSSQDTTTSPLNNAIALGGQPHSTFMDIVALVQEKAPRGYPGIAASLFDGFFGGQAIRNTGILRGVVSAIEQSSSRTVTYNGKGLDATVRGGNRVGEFTYSETSARHLNEYVKHGPYAGEPSRPYMNSPHTINEIISTGTGRPDPGGSPGVVRYDVPGSFRGSQGVWELVVDRGNNKIYHFNFRD
jgi:hypothetical protein